MENIKYSTLTTDSKQNLQAESYQQSRTFKLPKAFRNYNADLKNWLGIVLSTTLMFNLLHIRQGYLTSLQTQQIIGLTCLLHIIYLYFYVQKVKNLGLTKIQTFSFVASAISLVANIPLSSLFLLIAAVLSLKISLKYQKTLDFDKKSIFALLFFSVIIFAKFDGIISCRWSLLLFPMPLVAVLIITVMIKVTFQVNQLDSFFGYCSLKRKCFKFAIIILFLLAILNPFFYISYQTYLSEDVSYLVSFSAIFNLLILIFTLCFLRELHFTNFQHQSYQQYLIARVYDRSFQKHRRINKSSEFPRELPLCVLCWQYKANLIESFCQHTTFCQKCRAKMTQKEYFYYCPICRCHRSEHTLRLRQCQLFQNIYFKLRFYKDNIYRYVN